MDQHASFIGSPVWMRISVAVLVRLTSTIFSGTSLSAGVHAGAANAGETTLAARTSPRPGTPRMTPSDRPPPPARGSARLPLRTPTNRPPGPFRPVHREYYSDRRLPRPLRWTPRVLTLV